MSDQPMSDEAINRAIGKLEKDTSFTCPKCGGSHFGSSSRREDDGTSTIYARNCHDEFNRGCKWSGPPEESYYGKDYLHDEAAAVRLWKAHLRKNWLVGPMEDENVWVAHNAMSGTRFEAPTFPRVVCLAVLREKGAER